MLFAAEHGGEADTPQFVPSYISPLSFATFCWDNNDIIEETLSGQGTTHCTNGIVVQRQVQFAANQPYPTTSVQRAASNCRQRSIKCPPQLDIDFVAGQREQPALIAMGSELLTLFSE